jgi:hypothetical protein
MKTKNQDEICEFVREIIAARTGEPVALTSKPELDDRGSRTVEELWESPSRSYAIEHTRIEAFEHQIRNRVQVTRLLGPLRPALAGQLAGTFVLTVPSPEATAARAPYDAAQHEIAKRIREAAPRMAVGSTVQLRSDLLKLSLGLHRRHGAGSQLILHSVTEGDTEALRLNRVRAAFDHKLPKLLVWSAEGRETLLALESDDSFHSNYQLIFAAVASVLSERPFAPDIIVLAETDASLWSGWVFKDGVDVGNAVPLLNGVRCYQRGAVPHHRHGR